MSAKIDEALEALDRIDGDCFYSGSQSLDYSFEHDIDTIRAVLESMKWKPIESAPHGVWIIIYAYKTVQQACWNSNGWWDTFNGNRLDHSAAECWQPLPQSPESEGV